MSINHEVETLIPFNAARTAFPGGRKIALQTLHRWRLHGIRGVKLETILVGGLRYTSRESISRFLAAQNAGEMSLSPKITAKQRRKQAEAANAQLVAEGR